MRINDLEDMGNDSASISASNDNTINHEQSADLSVPDEEDLFTVESLFGIMGEYGNNLMIYSSESIILKHQINVGTIIRSFQFTKSNREVIVVTKD
mmetsp:Transcript_15803/g.21395  ORF Transcript_15803/g.21395 Transcript_15803/m.21395 type:complete len:96 (-) Transcript_15803:3026-3313(-)